MGREAARVRASRAGASAMRPRLLLVDGETFKYAYTISATFPPDTTLAQFQLMLQNLLAERFHLALHHETRASPGYDLVILPGGTKLKGENAHAFRQGACHQKNTLTRPCARAAQSASASVRRR
jgi:uncharacterized protein (TIGR03435 family)